MQPVKDFVVNKLAGPLIAVCALFAAMRYLPQATTTFQVPNLPTVNVVQVPEPPAKIVRSFVTKNDEAIAPELEAKITSLLESGSSGEYQYVGYPESGKLRRKRVLIEDLDAPVVIKPAPLVMPTTPPVVQPAPPGTFVIYVYEKDETAVPAGVYAGLNQLSKTKKAAFASTFEKDTKDGTGEVGEQYKVAVAEALKQGLPALVAHNGPTIIKTIKAPKTEAEVLSIAP